MFKDRFDAADQLAHKLRVYKKDPRVVVVAIPRGGLQIGARIAQTLAVPLDIILTKKIGAPGSPEQAIGAVSLTSHVVDPTYPVDQNYLNSEIKKIRATLQERQKKYHRTKKPLSLANKIVILTDDGVATGHTLLAAISLIQQERPQKIIVALPGGAPEIIKKIKTQVDDVICLEIPDFFYAVGQLYMNFPQLDDEQAIALLEESL